MNENRTDWFMFGIAAVLALFGALMVYSASAMVSLKETDYVSQNTYFYKQIGFTLGGLVAMFVVSRIDYHFYQKPWVVYGAIALTAILLAAVFASQTLHAVVAFTITPAVTSNTYSGPVTMQVTGLTNTETVVIQKFMDANTNGLVDGGDLLWQQYNLTDGGNFIIGGLTNITVPGDADGSANGTITAKLNFQTDFLQTFVGKYLVKLSSPGGHFLPLTNTFTVTNFPYGQRFTGTVASNGVAVANAIIILFPANHDGNPAGGCVANNSGVYTLPMTAGTYQMTALKSNFVATFRTAPSVTLTNNTTNTVNLNLVAATQSISGKVVDANNSSLGLPGLLVPVQTKDSSLLTICFTDTNGNFSARVTANQWKVGADSATVAFHGYVGLQNKITVNTTTGSVAGVTISLPKATGCFYGSVKDNLGNPLAGEVALYANDNNNYLYQNDGYTETNGSYVTGVVGGLGGTDPWTVSVDNSKDFPGYNFSQPAVNQNGGTNITVGKAVLANITAIPATHTISGNVKFNGTNVVGVGVSANATIGGLNYNLNNVDTDTNGNYTFNVANGSWSVTVYDCGCSDSDSLNTILNGVTYQDPNSQNVNINNNNGTANFTVPACAGIQISTTSLPDGQVGALYDQFLQGSTCTGTQNWSVNDPADFPPGLNLSGTGEMNGTPSSGGTYNFSVHLDDGNGSFMDQSLSVFISGGGGSLGITTTSLPDGIVGGVYSQPLTASGGSQPYSWSLTPGSLPLPDGISLSASGVLSGTPTTLAIGTNYFLVRVSDNSANTADQLLSITTYPALVMSNNALPNGTNGTAYSAQVVVSGGAPFFIGNIPDGYGAIFPSGSLPPGLNFSYGTITSSNALFVISGTPTNNGSFPFTMGAYDADGNQVQNNYSITIVSSSLQITTASLTNGTIGMAYTNQLQGSGGTPPYNWTIANGSQPLPVALALSTNGLISGVLAGSGTNTFIVRITDKNLITFTHAFTLITNPNPTLSLPTWTTNRFQMRLMGAVNQNYTVQMSTNLSLGNWSSLFVTNAATTNTIIVIDPAATNKQRYYRVLIGP